MPPLVPCTSCRRHIRIDHAACPFCATSVPANFASHVIPAATRRMDRWALFTFATAITVGACGGGTDDLGGSSAPLYGAPAEDGGAYVPDGGKDSGGPVPAYGLPFDGGGYDANVQPLYGLAFPDGGDGGDSGGPAPAYGLPFDGGHD